MSRWQKLRQAEVDLDRELFEAELEKLTTREREIRRRIENLYAAHPDMDPDAHQKPVTGSVERSPLTVNGYTEILEGEAGRTNGVDGLDGLDDANERKGKKRKMEAR
jgi:COMPASS component SPP1